MPEFPEPDLVDHGDPSSRPALEALGRATWDAALDWLYGLARERPISPLPYAEARRAYFGPTNEPAPAPAEPTSSDAVLAEFRERIAPGVFAAQHPGAFSYFTPPPLPMSIAGEVLAQWVHQGVDVWHAGPVAAFVEEEVTSWLRALAGASAVAQDAAAKVEAKADAKLHSAIKPEPRDGNWMKRHESFNARVKQGNADLLFIGDSITE